MSENYYVIPVDFISSDLNWVKQIHIANVNWNGVMLQAVRGDEPFKKNFHSDMSSAFCYAGVYGFPTLESWDDIRNLLETGDYAIIGESYGNEAIPVDEFIDMVENNKSPRNSRYLSQREWLMKDPYFLNELSFVSATAIDVDGYSIEYREFF